MDDKNAPEVESAELADALADIDFSSLSDGSEGHSDPSSDESTERDPGSFRAPLDDPIEARQERASKANPSEDSGDVGSEGDAGAGKEAQRSEEEAAALADALQVLRRGRISDSLIEKMDESEILAQAEAIRPVQKANDELSRRLGQEGGNASMNDEGESGTESSRGREPSDEQPGPDNLNFDNSALLEHLGLAGDEDAEKAIAGFGNAIAKAVASQFSPLQSEVAFMRGELAQNVGESVRSELVNSGRYPQFESLEKWEHVEAKAVDLLKSPAYSGNLRLALADAVRIHSGPGRDLPSPEEAKRNSASRRYGNPDRPSGSNRKEKESHASLLESNIEKSMSARGLI